MTFFQKKRDSFSGNGLLSSMTARRVGALCIALAVHAGLLWLWWQPKDTTGIQALAMVMAAAAETAEEVAEAMPEAEIEQLEQPEEAVETDPPPTDQPDVVETPAAASAAPALAGGSGDATTMPLALRWPTGNALLDLASSEGLALLVLDDQGQPVGHVDLHSGVFRAGMPAVLSGGDWDPEARLLPHPPARVLATLAGQPRDHRVAVLAPRQRVAAWTAASAGRSASFIRQGGGWQIR